MQVKRRDFLKKALIGSGAVLATGTIAQANMLKTESQGSNGVVIGHSPKKEVLYKMTPHWREYYSVAS